MDRRGGVGATDEMSLEEASSYQVIPWGCGSTKGGSIKMEPRKRDGSVILIEGSELRVKCGAGVRGK